MSAPRKSSTRHRRRQGFTATFTEPLIVLFIAGSLILIAVPTYLGFRNRAENAAAQANLSAAVPDIEAYYALNNSSYAGLSLHWLHGFDPGVKVDDPAANPAKQTATSYCVSATVGGKTWSKTGPAAPITNTAC